jgi:hypothetical protein
MQCGAKLSADDLAELIDGEPMPPEPETQSLGDQLTPTVRKLRSLKGKDTPPAPGVTYEFTQDEGVDVHIEPKVWAANNSTAQNVGDVETLRDEQGGAIAYETLTGIATIEYLAGLGAAFSLADGKAGINPRSDDGFDEFNYLDTPMSAGAAVAHLKRGGNVGILPEHSTGLVVLDLDTAAGDFIRAHGWVATGPRIKRANAPDRVKLLVLCPDAGDSLKLESSDGTRKVEVISKRKHAIAAGTHESGAVIECEVAYDLPLIEWARLVAIAQEWTGTKPADSPLSAQPKTRSAQGATGRTSGNMTPEEINAEIIRWNIDHEAEILAMLGNPKEGQYVRLRTERTPSARVTRHDGRIVLIDYGNNNQHIDLFDVFIGEKGIDKRVAVGRLLNGRDIETGILEA